MEMIKGNIYNWKHDPATKLRYLGYNYAGGGREHGWWHQFALECDTEGKVWCEVLTKDLPMLEITPVQQKPKCKVCNDTGVNRVDPDAGNCPDCP